MTTTREAALEAALCHICDYIDEPCDSTISSLKDDLRFIHSRAKRALSTPATEPQGYVEGPQFRDLKTCKGCSHFKSEYWREPSGDGETYDSGTSADCLKAGRSISTYYGSDPTPPEWCPLAARPASPDTRGMPRPEAVDALAAYQQADMDGIMVLVSRQAIEECLPSLRAIIGGQDRG